MYDDAITEKECVKKRKPHSTAKIRLLQHIAAMSAIAECLFSIYPSVSKRMLKVCVSETKVKVNVNVNVDLYSASS